MQRAAHIIAYFLPILFLCWPSRLFAENGQKKEVSSRWSTAFLIPLQYYQTKNALGTSSAFALAGLGASLQRQLWNRLYLSGSYQVNLNAATSAPIFSGVDIGTFWTLYGAESAYFAQEDVSAVFIPKHRVHFELGISQRSFDFISLLTQQQRSLAEANEVETEGSFWGLYARIRYDAAPLFANERWGIYFQVIQSQSSDILTTSILIATLGLTYEFKLY